MASTEAKGIMRLQALNRLNAVATRLLGECGMTPSQYSGLNKDPELAQIRMLEAIAGDLEGLEAAMSTNEPEPTNAPEPESVPTSEPDAAPTKPKTRTKHG